MKTWQRTTLIAGVAVAVGVAGGVVGSVAWGSSDAESNQLSEKVSIAGKINTLCGPVMEKYGDVVPPYETPLYGEPDTDYSAYETCTESNTATNIRYMADEQFVWNVDCLSAEGWGVRSPGAIEHEMKDAVTQSAIEANLIAPTGVDHAPLSLGKCVEFKPSDEVCEAARHWAARPGAELTVTHEALLIRMGCGS